MSSHTPQPEQVDLPPSSPSSRFDHQLPQQHAPNHQQQFDQHTPHDLPPPPLRPLQPQPYPASPFNLPVYSPYIYPRPSHPQPQTSQQQIRPSAGSSESEHDIKRMRISRACDGCRRKKIKCDTEGEGSTCKSCRLANTVCTFKDSAKKRGPPKG
ncbi:hypothetical protein BCR42DRAFT_66502 [Absidia repens]|uniref:Zn(2)-C6 fungal-type domain-containing protein n=1 Tax=Absidia repens TaxID=90262 RepID=A0A1X2ICA5_9FUNG|nr:hypothetical protein BCR42DRAFT_66502 [Absidia repens]